MKHSEKAAELFISGCNCAQAVFCAFSDVTGMEEETAMKLSSSFGGGMGRMREVCGACSGMFMVAGMLYGYSDTSDAELKAEHYALIQKLAKKFKDRNRTIVCRELLANMKPGCSPSPTPRNDEFYKARPCVRFVMDAADILDELIQEKNEGLSCS